MPLLLAERLCLFANVSIFILQHSNLLLQLPVLRLSLVQRPRVHGGGGGGGAGGCGGRGGGDAGRGCPEPLGEVSCGSVHLRVSSISSEDDISILTLEK